ncbi:helix-turn-helix transcriptional regulator [Thioclava sp.]|uniref:helix-turn-helix transcriptional regulator n=1 Tax=Thioclava sp. TaxID=1933450 RepID=UPI003AA982AF
MMQSPPTNAAPLRLITKMDLMTLLSWSEASIDRRLREDPEFPTPLRLGPGSIRWRLDEVLAFIENLPRAHNWGDDE